MILRVTAVTIAVAALADPALSVSRAVRQSLTVAILETPSLSAPDGGGTRRERAYRSANTLAAALEDDYTVSVHAQSANSTADPCPRGAACVVISDGVRPRTMEWQPRFLGGVSVGTPLTPNVAITAIDAPGEADLSAMAAVDVHLEARGVGNATTTVQVLDGDVAVGSASYAWPTSKDDEPLRASVRVEWAPLGPGYREVRVVASAEPNEATLLDNEVRTSVSVASRRANVLVYEPQVSWVGTFVRRALESDDRFNVMVRARLGPGQTMASTAWPLSAEALEDRNVTTVIVVVPHLLGPAELDALELLVRRRGASLVLLLAAPPTGEIARRLHITGVERREASPVAIGMLKASEFIALRKPNAGATVLAAADADPVILSIPLGHGRILVSGAVDAWRFRADAAFDTFWRSLVADASEAAGEALAVTVSPRVASVGTPVDVDVEWRSVRDITETLEAAAVVACGARTTRIRLWPFGRRGRFRGAFDAPAAGQCTVRVSLDPLANAEASLRVFDEPRGSFGHEEALSAAIRAYGGAMVAAGDEGELVTKLRALASPQRASSPIRPMRSPWWIVPFTACLGVEWWRRRRKGLQ